MKYYQFPSVKQNEQNKISFLQSQGVAAIYSTGHIGRQTLYLLQKNGIHVACFINGPQRVSHGVLENIPVYSLEEFDSMGNYQIPIVYCEGHENSEDLLKGYTVIPWYLLYHDGIFSYQEILKMDPETLCLAKSMEKQKKQSLSIPSTAPQFFYVNLCVTQKCTLKCMHCNHLIPGFQHALHYDLTTIKLSLKTFFQATGYVYKFGILGGEAFLHPQVYDIIQLLLSTPQVGCVEILTNGTVIPDKDRLDILKNERLFLRISDYGICASALQSCIQFLQQNEILYQVYSDLVWSNYGLSNKAYGKSSSQLSMQFQKCSSSQCYHIKGDRLYHCPYSGSIDQQNLEGYPPIPCVELSSSKNAELLQREILELKQLPYINLCDYCHGDCGEPVVAGIQLP